MVKKLIGSVGLAPGTDTGFDLTTKGDTHGYSTTNARIPIGSDDQVLTADSGESLGLKWATPGGGAPTGSITMYGGLYDDTITGYLLCDGSAVSRTTYASLFAITSTQFGVGDGATTFNLPDLQAHFARGAPSSTSCGDTGGADTVALSEAQLASHTHTASVTDGGHTHTFVTNAFQLHGGSGANYVGGSSSSTTNSATTGISVSNSSTGSGTAHQNMPTYLEILYIIKT